MFQDSVPAGSYNDPFLSSVCVSIYNMSHINNNNNKQDVYRIMINNNNNNNSKPYMLMVSIVYTIHFLQNWGWFAIALPTFYV